jgi:hypothetical protein
MIVTLDTVLLVGGIVLEELLVERVERGVASSCTESSAEMSSQTWSLGSTLSHV